MKSLILTLVLLQSTLEFPQQGWFLQNPLPTAEDLRDTYFVDSLTGWAVGNCGTILKTTDSGENWSLQFSNNATLISNLHFIDAQIGIAVGSIIQKTSDGGIHWNDKFISPKYLWSVQFIETDTGWVVGENGFVSKTTDQGETWLVQNSGTTETLISIYFINSKIGWAAGRNGKIIKTTDGGINWISQITPPRFLAKINFF